MPTVRACACVFCVSPPIPPHPPPHTTRLQGRLRLLRPLLQHAQLRGRSAALGVELVHALPRLPLGRCSAQLRVAQRLLQRLHLGGAACAA